MKSEFNNTKNKVDSLSAEKTLEYETDEGTVKEKTTVSYKANNGNVIDNTVNTIAESKSVQKAAGFINKIIRLGASGFAGVFSGAGTYTLGEELFRDYVYTKEQYGKYIWEVPEPYVIAGSIFVGLIVMPIIFLLYTKLFMK